MFGELKFDEKGLITAVVQDYLTKEILMTAYMNEETLKQTIETGRATFWSRSRQEVWVKGETSGNYLNVVEIRVDCDGDCLVVIAKADGPACHTGNRTCFYRKIENNELAEDKKEPDKSYILAELSDVTEDRKKNPKEGSYTNYLFEKGIDKILTKLGEQSTGIVIAAKNPNSDEIKYEISDYLYYLMVLMAERDIRWKDVTDDLADRR